MADLVDLKVHVSAPGSQEASSQVRRFGDSIELATTAQNNHANATTKAIDRVQRLAQQNKALEDSLRRVNSAHKEHAMNLGMLAPKGFEMTAARIGHVTGLNSALSNMPGAGAMALGAFAGFMALEKAAEAVAGIFEHNVKVATALANAHLEATKSAIAGTKAQQEAGRGQAASDLDTTKSLAAIGGDALIRRANQLTQESGDKSARGALADIFGKFADPKDRERAMKMAQEASRLGLGSMASAAGAITPYNIRNQDPDQFLREFGAVGGRPLTAEELARRRANVAGSTLGGQAIGLAGEEARLENIKRAQISGAGVAIGGEAANIASPEAVKLSARFNEYTAQRNALMIQADEQERMIRGYNPITRLFTGGSLVSQKIGHLFGGEGTPLQRIEALDKTFDAGASDSIQIIRQEMSRTNQGLSSTLSGAAALLNQAASLLNQSPGSAPAAP